MMQFLQIIQVLSALMTVLLVLLHSAKGDGIAAIGGSAQMFKSTSNVEKGLNIITWIFAGIFLVSSAILGWGILR